MWTTLLRAATVGDKIVEYKGIRIIGLGGSMKYNSHPYNRFLPGSILKNKWQNEFGNWRGD